MLSSQKNYTQLFLGVVTVKESTQKVEKKQEMSQQKEVKKGMIIWLYIPIISYWLYFFSYNLSTISILN